MPSGDKLRGDKETTENLKVNNKDVHNTRALRLTEAKILRLVKYYRSTNVLDDEWKYSLSNAKLLVG